MVIIYENEVMPKIVLVNLKTMKNLGRIETIQTVAALASTRIGKKVLVILVKLAIRHLQSMCLMLKIIIIKKLWIHLYFFFQKKTPTFQIKYLPSSHQENGSISQPAISLDCPSNQRRTTYLQVSSNILWLSLEFRHKKNFEKLQFNLSSECHCWNKWFLEISSK